MLTKGGEARRGGADVVLGRWGYSAVLHAPPWGGGEVPGPRRSSPRIRHDSPRRLRTCAAGGRDLASWVEYGVSLRSESRREPAAILLRAPFTIHDRHRGRDD